jgi:aminoglycoside N3'-acetyltransferase
MVIMIGVGFDRCTEVHLGEYRLAQSPPIGGPE